ncbi:MAG: MBL fold metallo-hydrolase [Acidobacteriaceae bacterium]|nr:MBL fold metallo-hydrolase [Acidobacteriaceae bacterium]
MLRRTRSSVVLEGGAHYLLDASPDLSRQLVREHITHVDALFLTHNHFDHCGGIGELESYVRICRQEAIPAYMSTESRNWFDTSYGYMSDCLTVTPWHIGTSVKLKGVTCTALEVQHAPGTIGVLLELDSGSRAAYLPDTGPLPEGTKERLRGIETLILGATFWKENQMPETHLSVQEAVEIALKLKVRDLYLTHVSMHYEPVTDSELVGYLQSCGSNVHLAYDGLGIEI